MAVSTYTTNMTDLYVGAGSTSGWSAIGGGASGLNAETDYFIQGTGCTTKNAFASNKKGMIYDSGADRASLVGTDGAFLLWTTQATPNSLDTINNGGIDLIIGSGSSAYKHWYVGGSDTIEFMGWILAAVNPSETTNEADTGSPTAVEQFVGVLFDLPSGGPTKGAPNAIDGIRAGRCDIIYEFGTSTDPDASFQLASDQRNDVTDRWGLITENQGAFFLSGLHQLGSGTNAVNFTDINKTMFWRDHPAVTAPFNTIDIQNVSSVINLTSVQMKALGTKSPGTWVTTDNATVNLTSCGFTDMGAFGFDTNTTVDTSTFLGCDQINHNGSTMNGSTVAGYTGLANTSAVLYDVALDPNGEMDNMSFVANDAILSHAIEFGANIPSSLTLTDCDFKGYSASQDVNDSIFHFKDTSGTITLNLIGCTSDVSFANSFRTDGATIVIVESPVTYTGTILDNDLNAEVGVRVRVEASDATGDLPYQEGVSITQATGVATAVHTAHGMSTGDLVVIRGAIEAGYNLLTTITVTGVNGYTYSCDSGLSSPATGTIVATGALVDTTTDGSGQFSVTRTYTQPQPIIGTARKSTTAPFFKPALISGIISNTLGLTTTTVLVLDE